MCGFINLHKTEFRPGNIVGNPFSTLLTHTQISCFRAELPLRSVDTPIKSHSKTFSLYSGVETIL